MPLAPVEVPTIFPVPDEARNSSSSDSILIDRQIYALDDGMFRALYDADLATWSLHTHLERPGGITCRIGFEVGAGGALYDRLYDPVRDEVHVLAEAGHRVEELQEVSGQELAQLHRQLLSSAI